MINTFFQLRNLFLIKFIHCKENRLQRILIKLTLIQYTFGIRSMRKTIEEIETNMAYRWFLGYGFHDKVPHFSTFGKNYERRFKETDLFEQIFYRILKTATEKKLISAEHVFIDSTHVKRVRISVNSKRKSFAKKHVLIKNAYKKKSIRIEKTMEKSLSRRISLIKKNQKKLKKVQPIQKVVTMLKTNVQNNLLIHFMQPQTVMVLYLARL